MRTAIIYLRSSKDRADVSIDVQREALQTLAAARGLTIVGEFSDTVESGKDEDRPGFQTLYDALRDRSRGWDTILVLDTSRLSRRIAAAYWFEERECKPRGIEIVYKNLPEMDAAERALVKAVFHGVDEWHSLVSKRKGLAGMKQNVQSGWRAGGRAPHGYVLKHEPTGAIRDGSPVMKSHLERGPDALVVSQYLKLRAEGVPRRAAIRQSGITLHDTSLIGMEWNALCYAGCTVWNVHAERQGGRAIGGTKRRPRPEWVVKEGTHEALITRPEADALLNHLEQKAQSRRDRAPEDYVLGGLLYTLAGRPWYGDRDDGVRYYRDARGRRVKAERIERSVIETIKVDLRSPLIIRALLDDARRMERPEAPAEAIERAYERIAALDRNINSLMATLAETTAKRPLLEQIERWEHEREQVRVTIVEQETVLERSRAAAKITEKDIERVISELAATFEDLPVVERRDVVREIVERVELDPASLTGRIGYYLPITGDKLASPRGFEPRLPP